MNFLIPVFIGIGFIAGLVFAFIAVLVWIAVAGPLQEWLCERVVDPLHPSKKKHLPLEQTSDGQYSILISDVHLDTWTPNTEYRAQDFREFLQWINGEDRVRELYINGDIMDMPPHPLNQPVVPILRIKPGEPGQPNRYPDQENIPDLGVLDDWNVSVLHDLFAVTKPITSLTGNHDLGLFGLKYVRPNMRTLPIRVAWNPSVVLEMTESRSLYIEHGHLRDPFLWLYLRYAVLELLQGPATAQRGGKVGMSKVAGTRSADVPVPASELYYEGRGNITPPKGEGFFPKLARYRFRLAARQLFRSIKSDIRDKVKVITMGHTHLPDRYEFPGGKLYINSGDWAGNDYHQCFLLIRPNGEVTGPHQWCSGLTLDKLISQ